MRFLGVDPDLTSTAFAVYDTEDNEVVHLAVVRASGYTDMLRQTRKFSVSNHAVDSDAAVIEGQQIYVASNRRNVDPNDMIQVAHVSGILACQFSCSIAIPKPAEWKGQRSKLAEHTKYAKLLGWETERAGGKDPYLVPTEDYVEVEMSDGKPVKKSDWKHLMDAIGLAIWGSTPNGQKFISKFTSA